jgi:hypothetical protein
VHAGANAALGYQHTAEGRDQVIAAALDKMIKQGKARQAKAKKAARKKPPRDAPG